MKRFAAMIALALACACRSEDESSKLILERHPCLGACPSYRLAVRSDGRVDYEGLGYYNTLRQSSTPPLFRRDSTWLPPDDVAKLFAAFERTRLPLLPNQYVPARRLVCPTFATDAPTLTIVRERRSRSDTLSVYYACLITPRWITRLGMYVDSVVGVERWLGPAPSRW